MCCTFLDKMYNIHVTNKSVLLLFTTGHPPGHPELMYDGRASSGIGTKLFAHISNNQINTANEYDEMIGSPLHRKFVKAVNKKPITFDAVLVITYKAYKDHYSSNLHFYESDERQIVEDDDQHYLNCFNSN